MFKVAGANLLGARTVRVWSYGGQPLGSGISYQGEVRPPRQMLHSAGLCTWAGRCAALRCPPLCTTASPSHPAPQELGVRLVPDQRPPPPARPLRVEVIRELHVGAEPQFVGVVSE